MVEYSVRLTADYKDSSDKRQYVLPVENESALVGMKNRVIDINESVAAGTDGGFSEFFVDQDGNHFNKFSDAKLYEVEETPIFGG